MGSKAVAALEVYKARQVLPIHSKVLESWRRGEVVQWRQIGKSDQSEFMGEMCQC